MRRVPSVDLLLFWGITGTLGVAHSLLLTKDTDWFAWAIFYILSWACSMIILVYCRFMYKEHNQFDYDESLTTNKLFYLFGGLIGVIFIASALVQEFARSSIWVPQPRMALAVGTLSFSSVLNDVFFQLTMVVNSEETMVLALSQVLRRKFASQFPLKYGWFGVALAVVIPRGAWSILHAYFSYVGPFAWVLVLSAFISGCVISWCAYNGKTRSFFVALAIHFLFNFSVIMGDALQLFGGS